MLSHVSAHTHTHTDTRTPEGGRTPGASGLSKHQHLAPSTGGALVGKLCPTHRCEFLTAGEQRAATQAVPARPLGAAPLCSSWKASLWICKYFNSQELKEGAGWGLGWLVGRPSVFIQASPSPRSGNSILETCSGVRVPYTRHELDTAQSSRAGRRGLGSSRSGPCRTAGRGWSSHRVRTATG